MNLKPPRVVTIDKKQFIGKRLRMSFVNDKTGELWRSFMPGRKQILHTTGNDLYSLQVFAPGYFANFNPANEFDKWALAEVNASDHIPEGMEAFTLPEGTYAVFHYTGSSNEGPQVFGYILGTWLPASAYVLDDRPHFEVLGEKYKTGAADSEEEIWIPVKPKA